MGVKTIAVLTSGGDAPGMNAAVRAAVRAALEHNITVYGVHEGYEGLVQGGAMIEPLDWRSVGAILQQGGTLLGTARSAAFRTPDGRLAAARHLVARGVDGLVVIGGDGSLSGATVFATEWPDLVASLRDQGATGADVAVEELAVVGLPGSIDNDLYGTDMSIGVDTALRNIVQAIDTLISTAASHQRTFVVETMGRRSGYLALYATLAGGGSWVLIPEQEMERRWSDAMIESLRRGYKAGRRHAIVVIAEGARHADGLPIGSEKIRQIMADRLGVEARVTVLGHVQRGGSPTAFDRILATRLGVGAIRELTDGAVAPPRMVGLRANKVVATPLVEVVTKSRAVDELVENGEYATALELRGQSFADVLHLVGTLSRSIPEHATEPDRPLAIMTGGADAPGMNAALRVAVRLALNAGRRVLAIRNGFQGLLRDEMEEMSWQTVAGWTPRGGTELGTSRYIPKPTEWQGIADILSHRDIGGLLIVGGWTAYQAVAAMQDMAAQYAGLRIPVVLIPASINNNLPATDFAIGSDSALNNIMEAVDKIKTSAFARKRVFIIEVMGRRTGYLSLMSALATGAEVVYLPEEGITLSRLLQDSRLMKDGFARGKRMGIIINGDGASRHYTTDFIVRALEQDGGEWYDARSAILGHLQRGGAPSPFDRIQASRLAAAATRHLLESMADGSCEARVAGLRGHVRMTPLREAIQEMDLAEERPKETWWLPQLVAARILSQPGPRYLADHGIPIVYPALADPVP